MVTRGHRSTWPEQERELPAGLFEPRLKLWVERDGRLVMSDFRIWLLELIYETGSLARAAEQLNISYRQAWGKLKEVEDNLGVPLISSKIGGPGGGSSCLTRVGSDLVQRYREFRRRAEAAIGQAFADVFPQADGELPAPVCGDPRDSEPPQRNAPGAT